ncbi:MAG: hypothetical protein NC177_10520 [Ruminococcus flavefaciens]|nr:hypothetical protein [Ruminococcus flavefaciens]
METEKQEEIIIDTDEECTDSTEKLLEKYDRRSRRKADDVPAMQTVVCIITAVLIFGLNAFYPEVGGEIFRKLNELAFSEKEIFPNPIDLITQLL